MGSLLKICLSIKSGQDRSKENAAQAVHRILRSNYPMYPDGRVGDRKSAAGCLFTAVLSYQTAITCHIV